MQNNKNYQQSAAVVMAGGRGTRINAGDLPKVMMPVNGRPMVDYVIEAVKASVIAKTPVVVVGYQADKVRSYLGAGVRYALQEQQLGTGHAVGCARSILEGNAEQIIVLNGDHPTIRPGTINRLLEQQLREENVITMATVVVNDFDGWRVGMANYGRVVRDQEGRFVRVVEYKDATEEQKQIKEINPNYFCFQAKWLWEHVDQIRNNNNQKEYYLPDLLAMAVQENMPLGTTSAVPEEALGINTMEELGLIEELLK